MINLIADLVKHIPVEVYNSEINRHKDFIKSRVGTQFPATRVGDSFFSVMKLENRVIFVDEGQFFGDGLLAVATEASKYTSKAKVFISGLNIDSEGKPFGPMKDILEVANRTILCRSWCQQCYQSADYTYSLTPKDEAIRVGEADFEPRCRKCWHDGMKGRLS